jgi:hypothetical protein
MKIKRILKLGTLVGAIFYAPAALSQTIASISICEVSTVAGVPGAICPPGSGDTHQLVLAPDGKSINAYAPLGVEGTSDEHSSIFPPGSLAFQDSPSGPLKPNPDYLFFVAAQIKSAPDLGLVVLSGGSGPKLHQWTLRSAGADGYFSKLFVAPMGGFCPADNDNGTFEKDGTFDLNYAAPGSVLLIRPRALVIFS